MNLVVQGGRIEDDVLKALEQACSPKRTDHIDANAVRLVGASDSGRAASICAGAGLDWAWVPEGRHLGDFGLFVTDMDSTLIDIECIDEIAGMQGLKTEVAAITEAAMRGDIDFGESLTRRVSVLAGLPEAALGQVYDQRMRLNPGAERLIAGLKAAGVHTVLVSGGFTYFTDRLKARLGFDHAYANELEVHEGLLTGKVIGPVVDGPAKAAHLRRIRDAMGIGPDKVIAVGDGANDAPMLRAAGLGVAFRAKPVLREVADCTIDHAGLDGILNLFD
ncbi:MAG TPA: phosphoserine phosphatase SerB [Rhodocyclaceae bacterium]|jgi:phosphoserine phosphatase|nr:phosphoserine phosphatase SerB [Rhodocyclaceae bacterium]